MSRDNPPDDTSTGAYSQELGHRTVTDASVMTFGGLTGDYAQMHFDLDFGHQAGMGGPIAHGLLSASWAMGALTLHAPERLCVGEDSAHPVGFQIRFKRMVHLGDRFTLRWRPRQGPAVPGLEALDTLDTDFEVLNQKTEITCSGSVSVHRSVAGDADARREPPVALSIEPWSASQVRAPLYAEELIERGPRGESLGRTVTETDLVAWSNFTGELNPLYLNDVFARRGPFGQRVASPMWSFCLGFGDYLRDLLSISMHSSGFAGHLGDSWRLLAPIAIGDTLRTRHKPIAFEQSKSRPEMGLVRFGLQLLNQHDVIVQDGEVVMMMPSGQGRA